MVPKYKYTQSLYENSKTITIKTARVMTTCLLNNQKIMQLTLT